MTRPVAATNNAPAWVDLASADAAASREFYGRLLAGHAGRPIRNRDGPAGRQLRPPADGHLARRHGVSDEPPGRPR
jgi:hypothetical protein